MNLENNRALLALSRVWILDGDLMVCRGCGAGLVASRDGEPMRHRGSCLNSAFVYPWSDLRKAIDLDRPRGQSAGEKPVA